VALVAASMSTRATPIGSTSSSETPSDVTGSQELVNEIDDNDKDEHGLDEGDGVQSVDVDNEDSHDIRQKTDDVGASLLPSLAEITPAAIFQAMPSESSVIPSSLMVDSSTSTPSTVGTGSSKTKRDPEGELTGETDLMTNRRVDPSDGGDRHEQRAENGSRR